MQTQRRDWISFQQYTVVYFVVSACLVIALGQGLVGVLEKGIIDGVTSRAKVEGAHAQSMASCANTDHVHTVLRGELLASIAAYYGLAEKQLVAYNHLAGPATIYTNQLICIPSLVMKEYKPVSVVRMIRLPMKLKVPVALENDTLQTQIEKQARPAAPAFQPVPVNSLSVQADQRSTPVKFTAQSQLGIAAGQNNAYPFGQCTWWATQRYYQLHNVYVPWMYDANAGQWVDRARDYGWHVSSVPTVGSILVLRGGVEGAQGVGHVGIVEQVQGNGTVIASSMNWGARPGTVTNSMFAEGPGVAFISQ